MYVNATEYISVSWKIAADELTTKDNKSDPLSQHGCIPKK